MSRVAKKMLVALALAASGCEAVAGLDDRVADPLPIGTGGASGVGGSSEGLGGTASSGKGGSTTGGSAGTVASTGGGGGVGGTGGAAAGTGGAGTGGAAGVGGGGKAGTGGVGGAAGSAGAGASGGAGAGGASGASGSAGAGGVVLPPGCLPTTGSPNFRIGDLVPDFKRYDFCVTPMDDPTAKTTPIFKAGADCPSNGLGYKDISALFPLKAGAYAVKVIDAATTNCDGPGIVTLPSAVVDDGAYTAVYLIGDGVGAPSLKSIRESRPSQALAAKYRFFHAAPGVAEQDFGVTDQADLPASLLVTVFSKVGYGTTAMMGVSPQGAIDANGYLETQGVGGSPLPLGVANPGTMVANIANAADLKGGRAYTVFEVGNPTLPSFPTELYVCEETAANGVYEKCGSGTAVNVTIDTYNTRLNGAFALPEVPRRPAILAAIPMQTSDVMCLTEVWSDADKKAIADAGKASGNFPYSYYPLTNDATPLDDPTDLMGKVPMPPTDPACKTATATMNAALDCMRANCVTTPGDENSSLPADGTSSACIKSKCLSKVLPLFSAGGGGCWTCVLSNLFGYESIGYIRNACTTDPTAVLAFRGATGVQILSRYPINAPETLVVPSTEFRGAHLRAPVQLPNGTTIDVYCTDLTTVQSDCLTRPYTGQYASGASDCKTAWANEQKLQIQKLVGWVKAKSGTLKRRTFIAGEFGVGAAFDDGNMADALTAVSPMNYPLLSAPFSAATPPGYTPKCTSCNTNPWVVGVGGVATGSSTWTSNIFMQDIPEIDVKSTSIFFTEPTITYTNPVNMLTMMTLSEYYGMRSLVRIAP